MMNDVTQTLSRIEDGDPTAADQLLPLVYDEMRKLAAAKLTQEKPGQTLQATALVHEAYLRLIGKDKPALSWDSRGHFFAAAAKAMQRILIENARRNKRLKHGGELLRLEMDEAQISVPEPREDLIALNEALDKLESADAAAAKLVQLRYFAGLKISEAAKVLRVSPRTADRLWAYARAWLHQELQGKTPMDIG